MQQLIIPKASLTATGIPLRSIPFPGMWKALFKCHEIFRKVAKECANSFAYQYPDYDKNVSKYAANMFARYGKGN
ncbi:aminoglycoside 6-adenylyltransferase [Bacillaceae bacterium Marseille-Q3522]|nr:aminoglycoside 6-adenylyltransferase [Bacillaceae bacterium Marseille-Q3522]